jgi:putative intracellular protease/amidase
MKQMKKNNKIPNFRAHRRLFTLLTTLMLALAACSAVAKPRNVAVLVFEGVELLDFAGPAETFSQAQDSEGNDLYNVYLVSKDGKMLKSQGFVQVTPNYSIKNAPKPDILVIPGGDVNETMVDSATKAWIRGVVESKSHVLSVCNGASVLGTMGYLDGRQIATHRANFEIIRAVSPKIQVLDDAKLVYQGQFTTAAGISSGIDGALYTIAREHGLAIAKRAAIDMEYMYWPGLQASSLEDFTKKDGDRVIQIGGPRELEREWGINSLLINLANGDPLATTAERYRELYGKATGHDKEMLEPQSLEEIAVWLYSVGRDKNVALRLAELNANVHGQRPAAWVCLGKIQSKVGHASHASNSVAQALKLDPNNKSALALRKYLQSGGSK